MAHRHREVSRIEGFSDAVFGFAITLLVVSLEVPKTFSELLTAMRGFPAFAVCFAMLFQVWWRHYRFFRAYDLEDRPVIAPDRAAAVRGAVLCLSAEVPVDGRVLAARRRPRRGGDADHRPRRRCCSRSTGSVSRRCSASWRRCTGTRIGQRAALGLTPIETLETRVQIYSNLGLSAIALTSVAIAAIAWRVAPSLVSFAGYVYFLIGFVEWGLGEYKGRERRESASAGPSTAGTSPA